MKNQSKKIKWQDPLNFAKKIATNYKQESWIFLYSALNGKVKNSFSYIGIFPNENLICDSFNKAEKIIKKSNQKWFGYFSYEVGEDFEKFNKNERSFISLPKIWLINFAVILEFNHQKKTLIAYFYDEKKLEKILSWQKILEIDNNLKVKNFDSNFSDKSYLKAIKNIKEKIADGDFYQSNLTRKFFGQLTKKQNQQQAFKAFLDLTKISPANYSAFLKLEENYIISASPELFLYAKNNKILSRPIKGTAPRSSNLIQDRKNILTLKNNHKEIAENLMIVDLVRNDLSRICKAGSVEVKKIFDVTSYKNIHHMSSEIHGKIAKNFCAFDAIKACFPPGSMTGAPKIKAIEIANEEEKIARGIYSGTIGIFSGSEINSSVVIRTLILSQNKFEFQVGGAITFDSDKELELEEIFNKANGISKLLKIKLKNF